MRIQDDYVRYAMHAYQNPALTSIEGFSKDLATIRHINRILKTNKKISVSHLLNLFILLFNVFAHKECVVMLFHRIDMQYWPTIKPFIVFLNYMPETISELGVDSSSIPMNQEIIDELRKI